MPPRGSSAAMLDNWDTSTAAHPAAAFEPTPYMSYDSTDSLDYLVCLEVLPWESYGFLPARVVVEHVEWVMSTPLNVMQPALCTHAYRGMFYT